MLSSRKSPELEVMKQKIEQAKHEIELKKLNIKSGSKRAD